MLYDYIVKAANKAVSMQEIDGSMPPGHNGPYYDIETPVRNTSHWLITYLKAYEITGDIKFKDAAYKASKYLCSNIARPMGATFWHRKNPEKDFCNGLIGQAWTIEALAEAAEPLEDSILNVIAKEVFLLHPFNWEKGIWQRVAVDGMHLTIDETLNHQLWFAAAGSLTMNSDNEVRSRVDRFFDKLENHIGLYSSGLIKHSLISNRRIKKEIKYIIKRFNSNNEELHKAIGYHLFNLYALALLKQKKPDHCFWQSRKFNKIWSFANSGYFKSALNKNKYGYPYNPPGFEMAFALEVFGEQSIEKQSMWLGEQFKRCYDKESNLMVLGTEDPVTHAARFYEATRLCDLYFEFN